jgi:uncharacterized protein (UPF0276 family)
MLTMNRFAPAPGPAHANVGIGWRHPHYAELLETRPALGFLEVHSENFFADGGAALALLQQARASYPLSLHGVGLALGSAAGVDPWHLEQLARLAERVAPVRISDHACFARAIVHGREVHAGDLLPIPFNQESLDVFCRNVQQVQERLKRPLLVENLSAYLTPAGSDRSETDFLGELAQRTGCGLLVDVNNIYVNALNARIAGGPDAPDPLRACGHWLAQLPAGAVGEIHLAGHCVMADIVIDDHGSRVAEDVWALYAQAVGRFGAVPTLIEWDTAIPPLAVLLGEAERARRMSRPGGTPA